MENNNNDTNTTLVDDVNNVIHPPNLVGVQNNIPKTRKCGFCGLLGHNKRTCPQIITNGKIIDFMIDDIQTDFMQHEDLH